MKKNIYISLLILIATFFSHQIFGMEEKENKPTVTTVTEEEGTLKEEEKIQQGEQSGGVATDVGSHHSSNCASNSDSAEETLKPEKKTISLNRLENLLQANLLKERHLLHPEKEGRALGETMAARDATYHKKQIESDRPEKEGLIAGRTLSARDLEVAKTKIGCDLPEQEGKIVGRTMAARDNAYQKEQIKSNLPEQEGAIAAKTIATRDAELNKIKLSGSFPEQDGIILGRTIVARDIAHHEALKKTNLPELEAESTARAMLARNNALKESRIPELEGTIAGITMATRDFELNRTKLTNNIPQLEGEVLAKTIAARDFFQNQEKMKLIYQHPFTHLGSLGIQAIETGFVQGGGHVLAKLIIASSDKFGNWLYSLCTPNGRKLSIDQEAQKTMEEITLLISDKQSISQLKKQGLASEKMKFYEKQIPTLANKKFDEWAENRLNRWGLKYQEPPIKKDSQEIIEVSPDPASFSIAPMIEEQQPISNTDNNAVPS